MRNAKYHSSFENFFNRLFRYFNKLPKESLPVDVRYLPVIDEKQNHRFELTKSIDFRQLFERHLDEIVTWKEYSDLSENVILMSPYGQIWDEQDNFNLNFNYIPSVTDILFERSNNSFKYNRKTADNFYALIENCVYLDEWQFLIKSPVYNLELEQKKAYITKDIYIKQIDHDDLHLFVPSVIHHGFGVNAYTPFLKTIIVTEETHKKGEASYIDEKTPIVFRNVVAALCVFSKHRFELGPFYIQPKNFWSFLSGIMSSYSPDEIHVHHDNKLVNRKEIVKFRSFWKTYESSIVNNPWIELASQRLLRLFYEMKQEDRIVDMMTILEILYLPESDAELKYRLSTRCAKVLARKIEEKKEIYEIIKLAYDIRSNVVHSGTVSSGTTKKLRKASLSLPDLMKKLEEYLYRSFEVFIRNPSVRNQMEDIVLS